MAGKKSVGYFVNWGIYGREFPPSMIPVQDVTHILYAFANLSILGHYAEIHYPGDSWNDVGNNLYGNFKAIYNLKKANKHLKLPLSIGGWTYSPSFHPVVVNPALRSEFVRSSVQLLEDYGLDGLDIDYEYPQNDQQAQGYVALLWELRQALDHHAQRKGANYRFLLTIAAPCGTDNYQKLRVRKMNQFLDFWNLMAYDFAGSWDSVVGHQSNLLGPPISFSQVVNFCAGQGVSPANLIIGIPLYGRSFMNTQGPGQPFNGIGPGSREAGVYDYRALPLPGTHIFRDEQMGASWVHDYNKKEMISFDDEQVGHWKGKWIRKMGLGGSMFWQLSGDKGAPRPDMEGGPGKEPQPGNSLMDEPNWLSYEGSKFDNMRKGMN
ncbi:glycoside hydrolase family 18 protein [Cylindrobasidium torrendii FP15055 ss-10]|uniref:chitinase n=1 Tax=Cylindrobasidium torrendii FP15055 ss-10 TaxID=1314674 RepID=A0A0D7AYF8_9AGAR|nr:glycoside hydrolase family 18 protein [Cylindrobasidium torrendii FP15055 ss-10]